MSGTKQLAGKAGKQSVRHFQVAPVARAVRLALAATTLALAGTGAAYAGTCSTTAGSTQCTGSFTDTLSFPDAVDLTLVVGDGGTTPTSVTPAAGAAGIDVTGDGALAITNYADIATSGADGLHVYSTGSATVTNDGSITTYVDGPGQEGIDASANGNVTVTNNGDVVAYGNSVYDVTAVRAETIGCGCTATVDNGVDGSIVAYSSDGSAIGVYAYAGSGHVDVDNAGAIQAIAYNGLADGVFAAGDQVDVHNSGAIGAQGYTWAAGIEAEGSDLTTVVNDGDVTSTVTGYMGQAFGIYAAGGDGGVSIENHGSIYVDGFYSTGIDAHGTGDVSVSNTVQVVSGSRNNTLYAVGIHAGSNGDDSAVSVTNGGLVVANSYYGSTGIEVVATGYNASGSVTNTGTVYAAQQSKYGTSAGIVVSADGDAHIDNSGSIYVVQGGSYGPPVLAPQGITPYFGGTAYGALALSFNGDASITNTGDIHVDSMPAGYAVGLLAASQNGNASVDNNAYVRARGKYAYGVMASSGGGDVAVHNGTDGQVYAESFIPMPYSFAAGLGGIATSGDVGIDNEGAVYAAAFGVAIGTLGVSSQGNVNETNSGAISAYAYYGTAVGMFGRADYGTAGLGNTGGVLAYSYNGDAIGLLARGDVAQATNAGHVQAYAYNNAYGIEAVGATSAGITNDGDVQAYGRETAIGALAVATYGDATIDGSGSIDVYGGHVAIGMYAYASGTATVSNGGAISAYSQYAMAEGIFAAGATVDASNAGDINAEAYGFAAGVDAHGDVVSVGNSGSIAATSHNGFAFGLYASGATTADATNSGTITVTGPHAYGIYATGGDLAVTNAGDVDAYSAGGQAFGVFVRSDAGDAAIDNTGLLRATSTYGNAVGALAVGDTVHVANAGDIEAETHAGAAFGMYVEAATSADLDNTGTISGHAGYGHALAVGLAAYSAGTLHITNAGTISATGDVDGTQAIGLLATAQGLVQVDNAGLITASHPDYAVAVSLDSGTGSILTNTGTIRTNAPVEGQVAVHGGDWIENVLNYGELDGALVLNGGDDLVFNGAHGVWNVGNHATDFGAGDDALVNGDGGLVNLTNAGIAFGAGDDQLVNGTGGLVDLTNGAIAFGDGDDALINGTGGTLLLHGGAISLGSSGAAGNSFTNTGTIRVVGAGNTIDMGTGPATTLVPSLNPLPLVNNGVIDFVDGAPDDVLTITGDLDGQGHLQVDLRPLAGTSDMLYVDGNVADGAVQTVDVDFGAPLTSALLKGTTTTFASISGASAAGSFVGGRVLGYSPSDFLNLQVNVTSQIDASGAAADVFSVGVTADGLSNTGSVAAALAPGAQSMVNSLVGTWRQRTGVQVDKGTIGMSPWFRMFNDRGDIRQDHVASNFGQGGTFGFDEANSGWELGLDIRPFEQLHAGLLIGESDGNQRLRDTGSGDVGGQTFGLYGTWIGDQGFYVDASFRWIGLTGRVRADGTQQYTDGEADAFNVEAGFGAWSLPGDVLIQPQVQYTHTSLDFHPLVADLTTFDGRSANSSRGRVGVLFSKTIAGNGGWTWIPYGSVNAIREFDGEYTYAINDDFVGMTSTKGTSALVELGLGVHKDKVTVSGGLNWTDGGALNSFFGGQLVLRTTW